jgi:hypothetical protein
MKLDRDEIIFYSGLIFCIILFLGLILTIGIRHYNIEDDLNIITESDNFCKDGPLYYLKTCERNYEKIYCLDMYNYEKVKRCS